MRSRPCFLWPRRRTDSPPGEFTAKVHAITSDADYTIRQAAYDLHKLRGKQLLDKPRAPSPGLLNPARTGDRAHSVDRRAVARCACRAADPSARVGRRCP